MISENERTKNDRFSLEKQRAWISILLHSLRGGLRASIPCYAESKRKFHPLCAYKLKRPVYFT